MQIKNMTIVRQHWAAVNNIGSCLLSAGSISKVAAIVLIRQNFVKAATRVKINLFRSLMALIIRFGILLLAVALGNADDSQKEGSSVGDLSLDSVRFLLYSDATEPNDFDILQLNDTKSIQSSGFDSSKPTKILIHGFRSQYNSTFPQNVKNGTTSTASLQRAHIAQILFFVAFLATKSDYAYNVVVVDWGLLAIPHATYRQYPRAVRNVPRVGDRVADFISWLKKDASLELDDVHIIGHSLGAHVSGDAGNIIQQRFDQAIARITGLDPAGPEFHPEIEGTRRLHSTDARYVDVIHTNAGKLGIFENIGQVDFWVNGGTGPQPGCSELESRDGLRQLLSGSCSHRMATVFFANTIKNEETQPICACGSRIKYTVDHSCCDRHVVFGEFSQSGTTGTFYLRYHVRDNDMPSYDEPTDDQTDDDEGSDEADE